MKTSVTFTVNLPLVVKKEEKFFISCCPVLDIWSQGGTLAKAEKNLIEAVRLFLMDCFERGSLDRVLKECGFVPIKKPSGSIRKPSRQKEINVPLPFVIDQALAQCRE
jgi:predicted RNase H-like HicB family nuclease